ncbi:MAG TPA: amidohydrolase [Sphingobacteriaceae bacterium]|nr:amidohydrolase [Sphingobacteriaceae bacterium]
MVDDFLAVDEELAGRLTAWRRHLHQYPELSFQEHETTKFIAEQLSTMGITVERPTPTGAVGIIEGSGPGPTVAVRADIDAVPVQEQNTFEFRSRNAGVMHACGHDGHTAIVLGVAQLLSRAKDRWPGRVKLLFQPAEETAPGGAQQLVEAGVLEGVDAIIGLHLIATMPLGTASTRPGAMMGSGDHFHIAIKGLGGHGGTPHRTVDTVLTAAQVIVNLQSVISRKVDPVQPAIITIHGVEAGGDYGLGTETAHVYGTISCLDEDLRRRLAAMVEQVAEHTCALAGAQHRISFRPGFPALVNDPRVAGVLARTARALLGPEGFKVQRPVLLSDDFAYYCREVPGAYLFLGARKEEGEQKPHHHPRFDFNEKALPLGAEILARAAVHLLRSPVD